MQARLQQQAEKERRLGEQAKFERDEFERIIEAAMAAMGSMDVHGGFQVEYHGEYIMIYHVSGEIQTKQLAI